jgi:monoamine oxidase
MDRRSFIRRAAMAASTVLVSGPTRSRTRVDVIVVGAGMAGLIAARELDRAGCRVALLEGSPRVGGRMFSVVGPSTHGVEMGAQVVHGSRAPTHGLLAELGIATRMIPEGDFLLLDQDGLLRPVDAQAQAALSAEFISAGQAYRGADISVAALIEQMGVTEAQAVQLASDSLSFAAEPDQISLFSLADYSPGWDVLTDANYQVIGGYSGVAEQLGLALGPVLRLNTRVERIEWRNGRVRVHARTPAGAERHDATAAVVTVPLSIMQAGQIGFGPDLPAWKIDALNQLAMGRVVVQQMTFSRDFWSDRLGGASGWTMEDGRVSFEVAHLSGDGPPALTGWVTGRAAGMLSGLAPAAVQDQVLGWIEAALPGSDPARLKRWSALKDWQREPYALGAYSFARPGGRYAQDRLAVPLQGALFFAGEATMAAPDYQTVHGAYRSGLRAAREVLAQL